MKRNHIRLSLICSLLCLPADIASSATTITGNVIAAWHADNVPAALSATALATGVTSAIVTRGPSLIADTSFPGYFDSYGWSSSVSYPGSASGDYLSIITIFDERFEVSLSRLRIAYSGAGSILVPRTIELRSSVDAYASTMIRDNAVVSFPAIGIMDVDLSHLDPITGSVEFRLWGFDSPGGLSDDPRAIFGLTNSPALVLDGKAMALVIEGSLIPEPTVIIQLVLGVFGALVVRRRR